MKVVYYGRDLYHADERAGHKYIARIPFGDKFRYFYDQAELAAYKAGKAGLEAGKAAGRAIGDMSRNASSAIDQMGKTARNTYMQAKSSINAAKGHKIYESQLKNKNNYMRNPNEKDIANARQGKSSNPLNRFSAEASRTMRDISSTASKTMKAAGKAVNDTVTGIKAKAIQKDLERKGVGKINTSLGDAYKTTNWTKQLHDKQTRENLINNKSLYKTPAWMPGKNGPKNNQGIATTTSKPKDNQGIVSTTGRHNTPKDNQGIDSRAGSRYMDSVKAVSDRSTGSTKSSSTKYVEPTGKGNSPKDNQGINSKDRTGKDNSSIHTSNHGIDSQKKARDEKNWKKATDDLKSSVKKDTTNLMAGAETAAANKSAVSAKKKATEEKKAAKSDSARLKSLTKSFEQRYIADGHDPADAKKWAKTAAENYIKKHPTK